MNDPAAFVREAVDRLRHDVPDRAIVAASGGIDSTAAALLAERALGNRATAIFVDTGLLREGEVSRVEGLFRASGLSFRTVPAEERFLNALKGVSDPERKRRRIGREFIRLFEDEATKVGTDRLVQGTIAPDWIESGGHRRDRIKTHHNVGGVPRSTHLKLVEPLRDLYKDEVRAVARELGIPASDRQPFPGPGLAVRVQGPLDRGRIQRARIANRIVEEEIERAVADGAIGRPWQYFAVLLHGRTVGVAGDNRVFGEAVSVRVVESVDAMTAKAFSLPPELLARVASRITRELSGEVVRVLYDVTDKPPSTIEWE